METAPWEHIGVESTEEVVRIGSAISAAVP
jgi:hypothetical protein